nr:hypothetical protein [Candidatus Sigynarchaeota archaeon]
MANNENDKEKEQEKAAGKDWSQYLEVTRKMIISLNNVAISTKSPLRFYAAVMEKLLVELNRIRLEVQHIWNWWDQFETIVGGKEGQTKRKELEEERKTIATISAEFAKEFKAVIKKVPSFNIEGPKPEIEGQDWAYNIETNILYLRNKDERYDDDIKAIKKELEAIKRKLKDNKAAVAKKK